MHRAHFSGPPAYWLMGVDGGVFTFGDAGFYGSLASSATAAPSVCMASAPDGHGYWLVGSDGGVFTFGDAGFYGSLAMTPHAAPVVGLAPTPTGHGYWLVGPDGGVFTFGDAGFEGSAANLSPAAPVVAVAGVGGSSGCLGAAMPSRLAVPAGSGPAGEGQWVPAGRLVGSTAAVYTTVLRPYPGGSPAGIAWMDMSRAVLRLYAGAGGQPPGNYLRVGQVAPADRAGLLAAFNSGFYIGSGGGYYYQTGWYSEGQNPVPLQAGEASLVIYTDGRARVGMWGRDFTMSPAVASVRQNLSLLVDGGRPATDLSIGAWGAVLAGHPITWRSGLGTDRWGNLLYVGGPNLSPADLAHLLISAGAVEAMELDINPMWVTFSTYATAPGQNDPAQVVGSLLVPGMYFGPERFLSSSNRDFFALFARR